jgi:hypothetical protein
VAAARGHPELDEARQLHATIPTHGTRLAISALQKATVSTNATEGDI